jgi:hypothetical protein
MTVVRRTIRSIPFRSADDTWTFIVDLIAPKSGKARDELLSIAGIASSMITETVMTESPIVVYGAGPRLRVYCLYDHDATSGTKASESDLSFVPTMDDWNLSLPCPSADLTWVVSALKAKSTHIKARDQSDKVEEVEDTEESFRQETQIDKGAFLRL